MKEKISDDFLSIFTEEEIGVARALLEIPRRINEEVYGPLLPFSWGAKTRRPAHQSRPRLLSSPSPPPLVPSPPPETSVRAEPILEPKGPTVKAQASSPVTPLSFPLSDSDEKSLRFKRKASVIEGREEELEKTKQYIAGFELLIRKIEKVRGYNYEQFGQATVKPHDSHKSNIITVHQSPFIMDRTANDNCSPSTGLLLASTNILNMIHDELSLSQAQYVGIQSSSCQQPFDDRSLRRAIAAQARRRRMQIYRSKNNFKLHFSYK